MCMSSKTVLSSIIPAVVNQKGNTLYNLFAMKVAFSSLYFVFSVFFRFFVNILPILQVLVFTWCVEWVIVV